MARNRKPTPTARTQQTAPTAIPADYKPVEWLGHTLPHPSLAFEHFRKYLLEKGGAIQPARKNGVILTTADGLPVAVSLLQFLQSVGIAPVNERGNGSYHPREAFNVLRKAGYPDSMLQVSSGSMPIAKKSAVCPHCQAAIPAKSLFCLNCGKAIPQTQTETPAAPAPTATAREVSSLEIAKQLTAARKRGK